MSKTAVVNQDAKIYIRIIDDDDLAIIKEAIQNHKSTKYEDMISTRFGITLTKIICYGESDTMTRNILNNIIPSYSNKLLTKTVKMYHCFVNGSPSIIMHEDVVSSWNCLMTKLNNPKLVVIYSI